MPTKRVTISILVLVGILLSACALPFDLLTQATPQPLEEVQTQQAGAQPNAVQDQQTQKLLVTVVALQTLIASSPTVAPTELPTQTMLPDNTLAPSSTPLPTSTPIVISTATAIPVVYPTPATGTTTGAMCDAASFVMDVTAADYTNFPVNAVFIKTWRLKNNGTCTWSTAYTLVFDHGDAMQGPASVNLPSPVAPGQSIDLSVTLKAPGTSGFYQGWWKLQDPNGTRFGVGADASVAFWVKITTGNYYAAVTPVPGATMSPYTSGSCTIQSVSPPPYTGYGKGGDFDSKWSVTNNSGTTWTTSSVDYKFLSGTKFYKKADTYDLTTDVPNGSTVTIIVDSIAPSSSGTYTMTWGIVQGSTTYCKMSVTITVN